MKPIWKEIIGYDGKYQVSDKGEIRSLSRYDLRGHLRKEKPLKVQKTKKGYLQIGLYKNGKEKKHLVHSLVADAFLENPLNLSDINHINEIKDDNRVDNLERCTHIYNCNYGRCQHNRLITRYGNYYKGVLKNA